MGIARADTITVTGTVSEATEPTAVHVGDAFSFFINFTIWDTANQYMAWAPSAGTIECAFNGSCTVEGRPSLLGHLGVGVGITYQNGVTYTEPLWSYSDGFTLVLDDNLAVVEVQCAGGPFRFWVGRNGEQYSELAQGNFMNTVTGHIDSVTYSQTPEPSTFLLSAPMLFGLWGYRRIRSRRAARIHL